MIAFNFGTAVALCAIGLFVASGFINWRLKIKLAKQIKIVIYISAVIISSILLTLFDEMKGSRVTIPIAVTFGIAVFLAKLVTKRRSGSSESSTNTDNGS